MSTPVGFQPLRNAGWYKRLHARLLAHGSARYERAVDARKRELLGGLRGTVLEIGPGAGANLPYYHRGVRWIGVEPNVHAHPYLLARAREAGLERVELYAGAAERLPRPDASVSAVVGSLVLCTVHDVPGALREILRVLEPGGRYAFVEHVAAPSGSWTRRLQRAVRPAWRVLGDGCRPDRETWRRIEEAGFSRVELEHFLVPLPVVGPHIAGVAIR